jgi:hypothetical protein
MIGSKIKIKKGRGDQLVHSELVRIGPGAKCKLLFLRETYFINQIIDNTSSISKDKIKLGIYIKVHLIQRPFKSHARVVGERKKRSAKRSDSRYVGPNTASIRSRHNSAQQ